MSQTTVEEHAISQILQGTDLSRSGSGLREDIATAIHAAFITIPRGSLPDVNIEELFKGHLVAVVRDEDGITTQWEVRKENIRHASQCAIAALAVASRLEEYFTSEEHAARVLQERRDELARQIAGEAERDPDCKVNYAGMVKTARIAIDRIIELENAVTQPAHVGTITPGQLKEMDCV